MAIRCVERIRSPVLTGIVSAIVRRICMTIGKGFLAMVNEVGGAVAKKICATAERWGNENASSWKHDSSFITFLGVNAVNSQGTST